MIVFNVTHWQAIQVKLRAMRITAGLGVSSPYRSRSRMTCPSRYSGHGIRQGPRLSYNLRGLVVTHIVADAGAKTETLRTKCIPPLAVEQPC